MDEKSLTEIATNAGISPDQVRYWASLLGGKPTRRGRVAYLAVDLAARVVEMGPLVAAGKTPKEAAKMVGDRPEDAQVLPDPEKALVPMAAGDVGPRIEALEKAVLTLAEEVRRSAGQINNLVVENQALRLRLEPPAVSFDSTPQPVIPWSPTPRVDPREYNPWYQVLWWELTAPEKLRRADA